MNLLPILPWNLASPGAELGQTMEAREAMEAALTFLAGADLDLDGAGSVVGHQLGQIFSATDENLF